MADAAGGSAAVAALRSELEAARGVLLPQLAGLSDLSRLPASADLAAVLAHEIDDHQRRRERIDQALAALTALDDDGYPVMPPIRISAALFAELAALQAALAAALAEFEAEPEAVSAEVTAGDPAPQ